MTTDYRLIHRPGALVVVIRSGAVWQIAARYPWPIEPGDGDDGERAPVAGVA